MSDDPEHGEQERFQNELRSGAAIAARLLGKDVAKAVAEAGQTRAIRTDDIEPNLGQMTEEQRGAAIAARLLGKDVAKAVAKASSTASTVGQRER